MSAFFQTSSLPASRQTIKKHLERKKKRKKEEAILIFLLNNVMTDQDFLRQKQLLQFAEAIFKSTHHTVTHSFNSNEDEKRKC